jgi:hypothetical protein
MDGTRVNPTALSLEAPTQPLTDRLAKTEKQEPEDNADER